MVSCMYHAQLYNRLPLNGVVTWLNETWNMVYLTIYFDWEVVLLPLAIAIALTFLRVFSDYALLKVGVEQFR